MSSRDKIPHMLRQLDAQRLSARMAASFVEVDRSCRPGRSWPAMWHSGRPRWPKPCAASGWGRTCGRAGPALTSGWRSTGSPSRRWPGRPPHRRPPTRSPSPARWGDRCRRRSARPRAATFSRGASRPPGNAVIIWSTPNTLRPWMSPSAAAPSPWVPRSSTRGWPPPHTRPRAGTFSEARRARRCRPPCSSVMATTPSLAALYEPMLARETNRRLGDGRRDRRRNGRKRCTTSPSGKGQACGLLTSRDDIAAAASLRRDRPRPLPDAAAAPEMFSELRWPGDDLPGHRYRHPQPRTRSRRPGRLRILRRPDVMAHLAQVERGRGSGRIHSGSGAGQFGAGHGLGVRTVAGRTMPGRSGRRGGVDQPRSGTGLAVQPMSPVFLYARSRELDELSTAFADDLAQLQVEFRSWPAVPTDECHWSSSCGSRQRRRRCAAADLDRVHLLRRRIDYGKAMSRSLDQLVTAVAAELMGADRGHAVAISERVLADLVDYFDVDLSFLRHNDHEIHATVLVASGRDATTFRNPTLSGSSTSPRPTRSSRSPSTSRNPCHPSGPAHDDYQRRIDAGHGPVSSRWRPFRCCPGTSPPACWASSSSATVTGPSTSQCAAGDRHPVRPAAGPDRRRGAATVYGPTRRSDRPGQPPGLIAHLDQRLPAGSPGRSRRSSSTWTGSRPSTTSSATPRATSSSGPCRATRDTGSQRMIARLGGDEFVVVPANRWTTEAPSHAPPVQELFSRGSPSAGVGEPRRQHRGGRRYSGRDAPSDLLRRADHALLSAKSGGGNGVGAVHRGMARRTNSATTWN